MVSWSSLLNAVVVGTRDGTIRVCCYDTEEFAPWSGPNAVPSPTRVRGPLQGPAVGQPLTTGLHTLAVISGVLASGAIPTCCAVTPHHVAPVSATVEAKPDQRAPMLVPPESVMRAAPAASSMTGDAPLTPPSSASASAPDSALISISRVRVPEREQRVTQGKRHGGSATVDGNAPSSGAGGGQQSVAAERAGRAARLGSPKAGGNANPRSPDGKRPPSSGGLTTPTGGGSGSVSGPVMSPPAPVVTTACTLFVGASDGTVSVLSVVLVPGGGAVAPDPLSPTGASELSVVAKRLPAHASTLMTLAYMRGVEDTTQSSLLLDGRGTGYVVSVDRCVGCGGWRWYFCDVCLFMFVVFGVVVVFCLSRFSSLSW